MATFVIGDVQGCAHALHRLLERCGYTDDDEIWFTGDLVNRGPDSTAILRFARSLGDRCRAVLGNHDLHLLARAAGVTNGKVRDTLEDVLDQPDGDELVAWLRSLPFVHDDGQWLLVHAGVLPSWDLDELHARAKHASKVLRSKKGTKMLGRLARPEDADLEARRNEHPVREAVSTARILTNLRCCGSDGSPRFAYTGPPEEAPPGLVPWYAHPDRRDLDRVVLCGHWAAQGIRRTGSMVALDSGCVWGRRLTAFRLDDESLIAVSCRKSR